jgi:hypothetical protein
VEVRREDDEGRDDVEIAYFDPITQNLSFCDLLHMRSQCNAARAALLADILLASSHIPSILKAQGDLTLTFLPRPD